MERSRAIKISKYLSKHLRHQPESLGIQLEAGGWVAVDRLLKACNDRQFSISRAELEEVVSSSEKQRFSLDETKTLIRANQGHSVKIDLQLKPQIPPDVLYHGTAQKSVSSIFESGLRKMSRHHVHLSREIETAKQVGSRHGSPVVFTIDAAAMSADGYIFYCSENNVWLVDRIEPKYLQLL